MDKKRKTAFLGLRTVVYNFMLTLDILVILCPLPFEGAICWQGLSLNARHGIRLMLEWDFVSRID